MRSDPSVAILAPELAAPSQLWMRRQIEILGALVRIVVTDKGHGHACPTGLKVTELRNVPWPLSKLEKARRWSAQFQILREFRDRDVSALLVHYLTRLVGFGRLWDWTDKPVFVHCHGYDVTWNLKDPMSGVGVHPAGYVDAVLGLKDRAHFIANSRWTERQLRNIGIPESRIHVKYFGIFSPDTPPERPERREPTILFLGRLSDFKGPREVIRAFDLAVEWGFAGRLVMAGEGELWAACRDLAAQSKAGDRIRFLGAVTPREGIELRSEADIFTAHNKVGWNNQREAFGVSNLEAMADGLPVVGTRSGGVPEVVEHEKTGILVDPGDIEAHAETFLRLGSDADLRRRLGEAGWRRARDLFSPAQELDRFLEIFQED